MENTEALELVCACRSIVRQFPDDQIRCIKRITALIAVHIRTWIDVHGEYRYSGRPAGRRGRAQRRRRRPNVMARIDRRFNFQR